MNDTLPLGPWSLDEHHPGDTRIYDANDEPVPDTLQNARLKAAAPTHDAALRLVCEVLARDRDGEPLPPGWAEDLKYTVIDRAIESADPGFDGSTTTTKEVMEGIRTFRALIAEADNQAASRTAS